MTNIKLYFPIRRLCFAFLFGTFLQHDANCNAFQPSLFSSSSRKCRMRRLSDMHRLRSTSISPGVSEGHDRQKGTTTSTVRKRTKTKRRRNSNSSNSSKASGKGLISKNLKDIESWRVYGVEVDPDALGPAEAFRPRRQGVPSLHPQHSYLSKPVVDSLTSRLRIKDRQEHEHIHEHEDEDEDEDSIIDEHTRSSILPSELQGARVVRRSLDARKKRKGNDKAGPNYTYVIDVDLTVAQARNLKFKHKPGRLELLQKPLAPAIATSNTHTQTNHANANANADDPSSKPKVIIVGAGPAGLFCALSLAESGLVTPIIVERGQPVEKRGRSIGALVHRRKLDSESNFSYGEGGAGTWSDGKLVTRIGRNSSAVRMVLETLVKYGAPERILVEGAPHLGTDNLVRLLMNMRKDLVTMGGEIRFGNRASKFHVDGGIMTGVELEYDCEQTPPQNVEGGQSNTKHTTETLLGDAVVLATGHSARDIYEELNNAGVQLESKGFAVGFRVEHPQSVINDIQYGQNWGQRVITNRPTTDTANAKHFSTKYSSEQTESHDGTLPVASYRLATNKAFDGDMNRGAYSFCMCPGGQIVPSSTEEGELCINGMSFSKRDSRWANAALVVTIPANDELLEKYTAENGALAGMAFQREMEERAYSFGGGNMTAPVQRLTDFVQERQSTSVPESSYRLGVKSAACHEIYPKPLYRALVDAIHKFDQQMPGFLCDEALLHGVETRTSSPTKIPRDPNTLQALNMENLYPAGEGGGFAGGIVSAAVDGLLVADAIKSKILSESHGMVHDGQIVSIGVDKY